MKNLTNFLNSMSLLHNLMDKLIHEGANDENTAYKVFIHDGSTWTNTGDYTINNNSDFIFFEWNDSRTDILHISDKDFYDNQEQIENSLGIDSKTWADIKGSLQPGDSLTHANCVCIRLN